MCKEYNELSRIDEYISHSNFQHESFCINFQTAFNIIITEVG